MDYLSEPDKWANLIGNVGVVVAALGAVLCVLWYWRVPWWRSAIGRHLQSYHIVVAALLVVGAIRVFYGDSDFWRYTRLVLFLGVPIVVWWRFIIIVRANRHH